MNNFKFFSIIAFIALSTVSFAQKITYTSSDWKRIGGCENFCGTCTVKERVSGSEYIEKTVNATYEDSERSVDVYIDGKFTGKYKITRRLSSCNDPSYITDIGYLYIRDMYTNIFRDEYSSEEGVLRLINYDALNHFKAGSIRKTTAEIEKRGGTPSIIKPDKLESSNVTPSELGKFTWREIGSDAEYKFDNGSDHWFYFEKGNFYCLINKGNTLPVTIRYYSVTKKGNKFYINKIEPDFLAAEDLISQHEIYKYSNGDSVTEEGKTIGKYDSKYVLDCDVCFWRNERFKEGETKTMEFYKKESTPSSGTYPVVFTCVRQNGILQWSSKFLSNQKPLQKDVCLGCEMTSGWFTDRQNSLGACNTNGGFCMVNSESSKIYPYVKKIQTTIDFRSDEETKKQEILDKEKEAELKQQEETKRGIFTTKTGLKYEIIKKGNGIHVSNEDEVYANYKILLPNGKIACQQKMHYLMSSTHLKEVEVLSQMDLESKYKFSTIGRDADRASFCGIRQEENIIVELELLDIIPSANNVDSPKRIAHMTKRRELSNIFLENNLKQPGIKQTKSGLQYKILKEGTGAYPSPNSKVKVNYISKVDDGTILFNTYGYGRPSEISLNDMNKGFSEGLQLMQKGSEFILYIPQTLNDNGDYFNYPITPYCTVIYEIELFDFYEIKPNNIKITNESGSNPNKLPETKKEDATYFLEKNMKLPDIKKTNSGLQYKILREGTGAFPNPNSTVKVHMIMKLEDGTEIDDTYKKGEPMTLPLNQVIKGFSEGIQLMKKGSKCILYIPPILGYGSNGTGKIKPTSVLVCEIELLEIK